MLLLSLHAMVLAFCLVLRIMNINETIVGDFFIIMSSIATIIYISSIKNLPKSIKLIIILGFVFRIILVFIDVFVTRLPDAGTDDEGFYRYSVAIYENGYSGFFQKVYGEVFTRLLSIAYFFIGSSRLSAQYLNVLLYAISAIILVKTLINFKVSGKTLFACILLFCLMPNSMLVNSILRRETIMELCICVSLLFLSKWRINPKVSYSFMTIFTMALASLFHTAFIFGALVFTLYFSLYDKKKQAVSFSVSKMSKLLIVSICAIFACVGFLSMWNNKFSTVSDMDDVYSATMRARGGSVYLEGYTINSFGDLVLFSPLKLFYFIFSPVPWKFRNIMDIASFMVDTLIIVVLLYKTIKMKKDSISKLLLVTFILLASVFALGTFNSGTAIRHRFSLSPFLLVSYSVVEARRRHGYKIEQEEGAVIMEKKEIAI